MEVEGLNEYEWEHIFHDLEIPRNGFDDVFTEASSLPATEAIDSWIEELLMNDDGEQTSAPNDCFTWSDLLVDSPNENFQVSDEHPPTEVKSSPNASESEGNLVDATRNPIDYDYKSNNNGDGNTRNFKSNGENDKSGDDNLEGKDIDSDADPLSKKRKRQLRNRDAAMKSRERKKIYVKDLEMKSRYMEAECRRLGRLLQCCYAENQMLRISMSNAYGASLTKPESAVLLLESLLLVSLVWLMVNMCLLSQSKVQAPHESEETKKQKQENAAQNRRGATVTDVSVILCFTRSKRCRGSRIKMKYNFKLDTAVV
ncbi:unnamed protein product [Amaranthus hypochondriacus]